MDPLTRTLVFFSHALNSKDLGSEVVDRTKYLLLDYLGVAIAGSLTESSQPVYRMLARSASAGPCTAIGTASRTSPEFAALANGAAAHSVELDDTLYKQSALRIKTLGLESRARIIHGDLLQQDYSSYDLLTIYLLPVAIQKITPIFEKQLKKGTRIVAHDFEFPQWTAAKVLDIDDDGEGRSHRLYLYRR